MLTSVRYCAPPIGVAVAVLSGDNATLCDEEELGPMITDIAALIDIEANTNIPNEIGMRSLLRGWIFLNSSETWAFTLVFVSINNDSAKTITAVMIDDTFWRT